MDCSGGTMPDGRACAPCRASRKPCRALWLLVVAVHGVASTGCSFAFTKGPRPEVQPPPPCTTSNAAPITDTVLSVVSVGLVVAGSLMYADSKKPLNCTPAEPFCSLGEIGTGVEEATGVGAIIAGGIGTLLFVPSAITGYNRTADCRASLQTNPQDAPQPPPSNPYSPLMPARRCPALGDAPVLCPSEGSSESSALVLDAARR